MLLLHFVISINIGTDKYRLMGQDQTTLRVLSLSVEEPQKSNAKKVLSLLQRGKHWVLVTLLLGNVIVNEALPVFLDSEIMGGGGWAVVIVSTGLIVTFGEIIPQSVCAKWGLAIGAKSSTLILWLMYTLSPIGYPVALLLDHMLGTYHQSTFSREGLKALVMLHEVPRSPFSTHNRECLHPEEASTACNLLSLSTASVLKVMTPLKNVFTLTTDTLLDDMIRYRILQTGHGRIPVFGKEQGDLIVGVLNVRSLIGLDFQEQHVLVGELELEPLRTVGAAVNLADIMGAFRVRQVEMVVVTEGGGVEDRALGIVTFRDMMEGIIGREMS